MTAGAAGDSVAAKGEGDFGGPVDVAPFWFTDRKGDAVREGGLLGRFIAGLSQEEKKSSLGSSAGV